MPHSFARTRAVVSFDIALLCQSLRASPSDVPSFSHSERCAKEDVHNEPEQLDCLRLARQIHRSERSPPYQAYRLTEDESELHDLHARTAQRKSGK